MKWTIHELIKKEKNQNDLFFLLDLSRFITEKQEDLVSVSETEVSGYYDYYKDEDLIVFDLNIKTVITMLCSLTLKEVNVSLDFNAVFNFSTVYIDDATHLLDGITIDIDQYIFSEILIEKPMKVYAPKALKNYKEDIFEATEEELTTNSPFAKLKK
ncbi:MAG: hypothetical protein KAU02_00585 [Tenericutes bacterium]|nr:hypothetical protein [Mycoplasmatota bacterium]